MSLRLKILQNNTFFFVLLFTIHVVGLQYVFDVKSLLFIVVSLASSLFFICNFSLKEVFFLILIYVFSFEKGLRGWGLTVVAQGREWWMYDYTLYYGLSLRTIIVFMLFLLYLPDLYRFFRDKFDFLNASCFLFLSIFFFFSFLSTIFSSDYFLSFFGFLRIVQAVCLFFVSIIVFQERKFREFIFITTCIIIIFNGFVSTKQFFYGGPIGLFLEDGLGYGNKGYFTSDGSIALYRSSGFIGHPTFFASYMSMLLAIVSGLLFSYMQKYGLKLKTLLVSLSAILGMFSVYTSFVRSSWFTLIFLFFSFLLFAIYKNKKFIKKIRYKHLIISLCVLFILTVVAGKPFYSRIMSTTEFLSDGSGVVRISLINEAVKMVQSFPYLGSGLNLSPRLMNEQTLLLPELRGFMFPVHNTFILFFAEIGIVGALSFIGFIFTVLVTSFRYVKHEVLYFGIWLSVVAFILNAQVHTLFNQDPSFDLLFLSLGFLVSICFEKNKSH